MFLSYFDAGAEWRYCNNAIFSRIVFVPNIEEQDIAASFRLTTH